MQVVSVNCGEIRTYHWRNGTASAMVKTPVSVGCEVTKLGLRWDAQADRQHHGGEDKALLLLPASNYALLDVTDRGYGFLGENLTVSGMDESEIRLGDRFRLGKEVVVEVTQPRSPCWKLGALMGEARFLTRYAESGRVGCYVRILKTGVLHAGDAMIRTHTEASAPSIQTLFLAKYRQTKSAEQWQVLRDAVTHAALSSAWRDELTRLLEIRHEHS